MRAVFTAHSPTLEIRKFESQKKVESEYANMHQPVSSHFAENGSVRLNGN